MKEEKSPAKVEIPTEIIERKIFLIRGQKVMLDKDLAELYQIKTGGLNLAVRRNLNRFPVDFMFQLVEEERDSLRLQFAISKGRGGRRYLPYAFTEHGVVMLSSVLKSDRAIEMNISIVRAFVRLRQILPAHKDLAKKMAELERTQKYHSQHLVNIYSTLKKLANEPKKDEGKMGFNVDK